MFESSFHLRTLRQRVKPFRLHWFPRLRSTNDHAAAMRKRGDLYAPALVLAGRQLAGRGRGTNAWWSTGGCVTVTFALPASLHFQPHQIPLIAGLAVRDALEELVGAGHLRLKWPNDLLLNDDRKVAGLLCERLLGADLIGVGINVNVSRGRMPRVLRSSSASLLELTSRPVPLNDVVSVLARHLHARFVRYDDHHFGQVLREYDRHHALVGRRVAVAVAAAPDAPRPLTGICIGLDRMGRLLLRDPHRRGILHHVIAGHVSLCEPARSRSLAAVPNPPTL